MKVQRIALFSLLLIAAGFTGCDRPSPPNATTSAPASQRSDAQPQQSASSAAAASTPQTPPAAPTPPAAKSGPPQITFEKMSHDFGVISDIQSLNLRFNFTNTGGERLIIHNIKASCGCTTPALAKREYEPGEQGHIDVAFKPAGAGSETKLLNVFTNAPPANPDEPFVRLQILADVRPFLLIQPEKLELGVLTYRQPHQATATVDCAVDPNFTIVSVKTTNPHISAEALPPAPGESKRTIVIHVSPMATWGSLFAWLEVAGSGRPSPDATPIVHTAKIRVQGQLFGQLRASPWDTFRFGAKPGETFERHIQITRANGEPFELHSATVVRCDLPGATVSVRKLAPHSYDLIFKATADRLRPMAEGLVTITTNVPGEEQIDIPIAGVVRTQDPSVR